MHTYKYDSGEMAKHAPTHSLRIISKYSISRHHRCRRRRRSKLPTLHGIVTSRYVLRVHMYRYVLSGPNNL